MTLPAAPPINLLQVCTEFGAPAGTPLSAFLRGGAWVPNTPTNAAVPVALPISLLDLLGASAAPAASVSISPQTVVGSRTGAGLCNATYELHNSGVARQAFNGGGFSNIPGEWLVAGAASSFEVRYTHQTGTMATISGTTFGTWTAMSTTTSIFLAQGGGVGVTSGQTLVEIRPAGGGANLDSAVIELYCERS